MGLLFNIVLNQAFILYEIVHPLLSFHQICQILILTLTAPGGGGGEAS